MPEPARGMRAGLRQRLPGQQNHKHALRGCQHRGLQNPLQRHCVYRGSWYWRDAGNFESKAEQNRAKLTMRGRAKQSMSEQSGAEAAKVQLHLRIHPELAKLIDAYRGPATRNAYAGMILEYEMKRRSGDLGQAHNALIALADRAKTDPSPLREIELATGIPAEELMEPVDGPRVAPAACPHPNARILKGLCRACGTYIG